VAAQPNTDLAVVKVDRSNLLAAEFGRSDELVVGQLAVAAGSPSDFDSYVTAGVISGLSRDFPAEHTGGYEPSLVDSIQTDAAISPGTQATPSDP
jgi:serine protease Do